MAEIILENIEYDLIIGEDGYDRDSVDEAVEQIVDAVSSSKDYIRVGGESRSADVVRSRLLKLNRFHVEFVLDCHEGEHDADTQHTPVPAHGAIQRSRIHGELLCCTGQA